MSEGEKAGELERRKILRLVNANFSQVFGTSVDAEISWKGEKAYVTLTGWAAVHAEVGDTLVLYASGETELEKEVSE